MHVLSGSRLVGAGDATVSMWGQIVALGSASGMGCEDGNGGLLASSPEDHHPLRGRLGPTFDWAKHDAARVIFNLCRRMVELDERLAGVLQVFQGRLYHPPTDSVLEVLPGTARLLQGRNPSLAIMDEVHVMDPGHLGCAGAGRWHSGSAAGARDLDGVR